MVITMIRYGTKPHWVWRSMVNLFWIYHMNGATTIHCVNDTYNYKVTICIWYNNIEIVILSHIHHYCYYSGYPIDF